MSFDEQKLGLILSIFSLNGYFFPCVLCNKSLFISSSQRYLLMSFPKTVVVLALMFRLVIHFRLIHVWYEIRIEVNFFPVAIHMAHGSFSTTCWKGCFLLFELLHYLCQTSVDHTNVGSVFPLLSLLNIFFYPYVSTTQSWFCRFIL